MNRVTITFLTLLALATVSSGQLWIRGKALGAGQGAWPDGVLAALSALALILSLAGLSYLLSRAEGSAVTIEVHPEDQEGDDAR